MADNIKFDTRFREQSVWSESGPRITDPNNMQKICEELANIGCIIVEHWHYCGSRSPSRVIFDDYEDFTNYLKNNAIAGDKVFVWSMSDLCKDDNILAYGKCPDDKGFTPESGSY